MTDTTAAGWRADAAAGTQQSLPEVKRRPTPSPGGHRSRRLLAFLGPGIPSRSVTWTRELGDRPRGRVKFGYTLLRGPALEAVSDPAAGAAARLGIATDRDSRRRPAAPAFPDPSTSCCGWPARPRSSLRPAEVIGTAIAKETSVRYPPVGGERSPRRCLPAAADDEQGFSLSRGLRHLAADRDRCLLWGSDRRGRAAGRRRSEGSHSGDRDLSPTPDAATSPSASSAPP